jgi:hypothetical protein
MCLPLVAHEGQRQKASSTGLLAECALSDAEFGNLQLEFPQSGRQRAHGAPQLEHSQVIALSGPAESWLAAGYLVWFGLPNPGSRLDLGNYPIHIAGISIPAHPGKSTVFCLAQTIDNSRSQSYITSLTMLTIADTKTTSLRLLRAFPPLHFAFA